MCNPTPFPARSFSFRSFAAPALTVVLAVAASLAPPPAPAAAQEPVDEAMVQRIVAEGRESSRVLELYDHLTNVIGPRLAGSPEYDEAAAWSRDRFAGWGLDAWLEAFEFGRGWELDGFTLEMLEPRYMPLIGYPEAWAPSTPGVLEGEVVYLGESTREEAEALGPRLAGAIVLGVPPQEVFVREDRPQPTEHDGPVRTGAPRTPRSSPEMGNRDLQEVLREGGAGVLLQPNIGEHGTLFVLGNRRTPDDAVPEVVVSTEQYNMLVRMARTGRAPTVRAAVRSRFLEGDPDQHNVIAEIPGTDPVIGDEVVMLGAHLDSWHSSPGGSDNADGSAAVLEAARILSALGVQPRRTIRFALWGAEEQGLIGSRAWVERHLAGDENAEARERFSAYFNHDPGIGPIYGFYLEEMEETVGPIMDPWIAALRSEGTRHNVPQAIPSTDHLSFHRVGVPGFNTIQSYEDYDVRTHHTNMDTYERLDETDLQEAAIVLATVAYHAAMRDERFPRPEGDVR